MPNHLWSFVTWLARLTPYLQQILSVRQKGSLRKPVRQIHIHLLQPIASSTRKQYFVGGGSWSNLRRRHQSLGFGSRTNLR
jgi:hypothetical protein